MIISTGELSGLRQDLGVASLALRLGTYDILHAGHSEGLSYAASLADNLVVGIMPDDYVSRRKGPGRPIRSAQDRIASIDDAEIVDFSFVAPSTVWGVARALQALRPNVYVEGAENAQSGLFKKGFLGILGVEYIVAEHVSSESTTLILQRFCPEEAVQLSSLTYRLSED